MSKVFITQSNYIPWKGYFDAINQADHFVIYDCVQYTKNDWRNRNKIKTRNGVEWLTIPVSQKSLDQKIYETKVSFEKWNIKHLKSIKGSYSKAKYASEIMPWIENLYLNCTFDNLSDINFYFIKAFCDFLNINTTIHQSKDFELKEDRNEKLISICKELNCRTYISGPAAKSYLNVGKFNSNGIEVDWLNYENYKEYSQSFPPFEHGVSVIDLILNEGTNSKYYLKSNIE